jgi:hypothetical protein
MAAGFVQGLSGFAFALVSMTIWAWRLDPIVAGPLVVFGSLGARWRNPQAPTSASRLPSRSNSEATLSGARLRPLVLARGDRDWASTRRRAAQRGGERRRRHPSLRGAQDRAALQARVRRREGAVLRVEAAAGFARCGGGLRRAPLSPPAVGTELDERR